jgi:type IV pilus assembly protein PilM
MLAKTIRSKVTPIGLDIGETALRAAQLRRSRSGFTITALTQVDRTLPAGGPPESCEQALRRLFSHSAFKGRSVIAALNPPEVEFHVLDVPQAALQGGENADKMLHWEIGRLTSLSAEQVETRHWLLPSRPGGAANAIGVSTSRNAVTGLLGMCHRGRLHCSCVDTGATALHRFGRLLRSWGEDEVWGLLDLGSRQSRLILCMGEAPILIRHTGDGGQSWTERIAEVLQLSLSAAEIQKKSHGVAVLGRREGRESAEPVTHDEVAVMLLSALRSELNEMAGEIKRSYEYVLSSYPGRRAGDLVLVGGGAGMPHLPEFLSGILGIAVRRCSAYWNDPRCRIRFTTQGRNSLEEFASAVGLAVTEP